MLRTRVEVSNVDQKTVIVYIVNTHPIQPVKILWQLVVKINIMTNLCSKLKISRGISSIIKTS